MTYNVCGGTLSLTQSINQSRHDDYCLIYTLNVNVHLLHFTVIVRDGSWSLVAVNGPLPALSVCRGPARPWSVIDQSRVNRVEWRSCSANVGMMDIDEVQSPCRWLQSNDIRSWSVRLLQQQVIRRIRHRSTQGITGETRRKLYSIRSCCLTSRRQGRNKPGPLFWRGRAVRVKALEKTAARGRAGTRESGIFSNNVIFFKFRCRTFWDFDTNTLIG